MSMDVVGEPNRNDRCNANRGRAVDATLTPETRETLGNLALNVQTHTELGDALAEADNMLTSVIKRHPEFDGPAAELRAKLAQLRDLHNEAGKEVMRYSHAYEDVMASAPGLDPQQAYWNPK